MVKIAVIEDSEKWRRIIKGFLEAYAKENKSDFLVEIFSDGNSFLCRDSQGYDLVFMDIDLPGASGLEVSRDLRKSNINVCLVFFTELAQFAVQGYEVNAFDYLVKPFTYSLFCLKMNRFLSHIGASNERSFVLKDGKSTQRIRYDDILYFESQKHYLFFHLSDCRFSRNCILDAGDWF